MTRGWTSRRRAKTAAGTCWGERLAVDFREVGRGDEPFLMVLQECDQVLIQIFDHRSDPFFKRQVNVQPASSSKTLAQTHVDVA